MSATEDSATGDRARDPESSFAVGLARMARAAVAFRDSWRDGPAPRSVGERMAYEHRRDEQRFQRETKQYARRTESLRRRARAAAVLSIGAGGAALADLLVAGPETLFWIGGPTSVLSGWLSVRNSREARAIEPPLRPSVPPPPPAPLPAGMPGDRESLALHKLRIQLARLLPNIAAIQAEAAEELRSADFEAAPAMGALVNRLTALYRVQQEMPGTAAAQTAAHSAEQVRSRLADGVQMYEELLQAALELMSAPDPTAFASQRLRDVALNLTSYSEGLRRAAQADL
ncbi:MAG: hypothetical protein KDC39_12175 [Actinobacteria bacterium]|nr:hypothetical protein [Actinomycetota bacterium]